MKSNIDKKFSAHYDAVEAELKSSTVGKQDMVVPPSSRPRSYSFIDPCLGRKLEKL